MEDNLNSFWKRVLDELEFQGKERKWLSQVTGISVSTMGKGLKRKSIPRADYALNISHALGVSLDYLVYGKEYEHKQEPSYDIQKMHKYYKTLLNLDALDENKKEPIINMINEMSNSYTK